MCVSCFYLKSWISPSAVLAVTRMNMLPRRIALIKMYFFTYVRNVILCWIGLKCFVWRSISDGRWNRRMQKKIAHRPWEYVMLVIIRSRIVVTLSIFFFTFPHTFYEKECLGIFLYRYYRNINCWSNGMSERGFQRWIKLTLLPLSQTSASLFLCEQVRCFTFSNGVRW